VARVINPAVGCHYFPPGPQLPSQPYQFRCLVNRGTMGVNSLPKTASRLRRRIHTDNQVCLEPARVVRPNKAAYNHSRLDGRLKLTASVFNRLWISMPAVLVAVPTVTQNSLHPLSTSSIIARHLLDFMVQEKDNSDRRTDSPSERHPIRTIDAPPPASSHFHTECPFCRKPRNLSWLGTGTE